MNRLMNKSAVFGCVMAVSLLSALTFTSCQRELVDEDNVVYVDQSGMRAVETVSTDNPIAKNEENIKNDLGSYRIDPKTGSNNYEIFKDTYTSLLARTAVEIGSGSSTNLAKASKNYAKYIDDYLNKASFGLYGFFCDLLIPGKKSADQQRYESIMNELQLQDLKLDQLSDQITNAKNEILGKISDDNLRDKIEKRYENFIKLLRDKGVFSEAFLNNERLNYSQYKTLIKEYKDFSENLNSLTGYFDIGGVDKKDITDSYCEYAKKNSCWSYQYNEFVDYFYQIETTPVIQNYGIMEKLWCPYIFSGYENGQACLVPNYNWELYTLENFLTINDLSENLNDFIKFTKEIELTISDEDYKSRKSEFADSMYNLKRNADKTWTVTLDINAASAENRFKLLLGFLTKKYEQKDSDERPYIDYSSGSEGKTEEEIIREAEELEKAGLNTSTIFAGDFYDNFFGFNTNNPSYISMRINETYKKAMNSYETYDKTTYNYMSYRYGKYDNWEKLESFIANYFKALNEGLKDIQDPTGTIYCVQNNKRYAILLGNVHLKENLLRIPGNAIEEFIRNLSYENSYNAVFHGANPDQEGNLDTAFRERFSMRGGSYLGDILKYNLKNGLYVYPTKDDYQKILDFYKNRRIQKGTVHFTEVRDSNNNPLGYWNIVKEVVTGSDGIIDNPTLKDILLYEAGIGTRLELEFVGDWSNRIPTYYATSKDLTDLMAEGINPRRNNYKNFFANYSGNIGLDKWDSECRRWIERENKDRSCWETKNCERFATGIYTVKADVSIKEFYDHENDDWIGSNTDIPRAMNRIWIIHGTIGNAFFNDYTGTYPLAKSDVPSYDNREIYFPMQLEMTSN